MSFNELYPNMYMYLLDIESGVIKDLDEVVNKLSYYLKLLNEDKTVWFKYSQLLRADKFYNSDYYALLKKRFSQIELRNPATKGLFNKILDRAER